MTGKIPPVGKTMVAACVAVMLSGCSGWFADEQEMMDKAMSYLQSDQMGAAAIELRNALQKNPGNAQARYLLAGINERFGDYATAEKEYRVAERDGWDAGLTRVGIARSYLRLGRYQDLLDQLQPETGWSGSERADLLALRALAEALLGNTAEAVEQVAKAHALDPVALQPLKVRVQLAMLDNRLADARQALDQALQSHGTDTELQLLNAGLYQLEGKTADARTIYQQVADQDSPGFVTANGRDARYRLIQICISAGELDKAGSLIQPLFRRDSNDPFTNYLGGLIAYQQSDFQRAEALLLKVLKLAPEHNPTRLLFGTVNFAERNYQQAAYFLGKYVAAVPDNLLARKLLARSYMLLGRAEEASATLQGLADSTATDAELLALVGLTDLERGDDVAGIAGLEKALHASPGDIAIRSELARAYIQAGDTGSAVRELQSMIAEGGEQLQSETLLVLARLKSGDFVDAIRLVLDMLARSPDDPVVMSLAGSVFATSGDRVEARKYLERALQIKPDLPPALLSLGQIEEIEAHLDKAAALYQQLVDLKTGSAIPMLALARVAEIRGDSDAVRHWLVQAVEYAPAEIKPRMFLAEYYLRTAQPDLARPLVDKAMALTPDVPDLLFLQARVMYAQREYLQARKVLEVVLEKDPAQSDARVLLAQVDTSLGRFDDAYSGLQAVLAASPGKLSALSQLAALQIRRQQYVEGLAFAEQIIQVAPEQALGYELAGDALAGSGEIDRAIRQYNLAWDRLHSEELVLKRSDAASRSGNMAMAVVYLQEWLAEHPRSTRVMQFLGSTLQSQGETRQAMAEYERVLDLDPQNVVAMNNLAVLVQDEDQLKALQLAERAWRMQPSNPGVMDTYGWLLVQQHQPERGLELLTEAVAGLPRDPDVRYHHAVALFRSGDQQRAKQLLKALLDEPQEFDGRPDAELLLLK